MKYSLVLLVCIAAVNAQSGQPQPEPPTGEQLPNELPPPDSEIVTIGANPAGDSQALKQSPVITLPSSASKPSISGSAMSNMPNMPNMQNMQNMQNMPSMSGMSSMPSMPSAPTMSQPHISPPRPKGCSPGCGPSEICAELGRSYCRPGQGCSVCIKMDSIRFPASAVYNMFQPKPAVPQVTMPSQVIPSTVPAQQPVNQYNPYRDPYYNQINNNRFGSYSNNPQMQQARTQSTNTSPNNLQTQRPRQQQQQQQQQHQQQQQQQTNSFSYNQQPTHTRPRQSTNTFSYTPQPTQQTQQTQQPTYDIFGNQNQQQSNTLSGGYYNQQPANNFDMFGFPIQQQSNSGFGSMFPFLWMDGFGMGF